MPRELQRNALALALEAIRAPGVTHESSQSANGDLEHLDTSILVEADMLDSLTNRLFESSLVTEDLENETSDAADEDVDQGRTGNASSESTRVSW